MLFYPLSKPTPPPPPPTLKGASQVGGAKTLMKRNGDLENQHAHQRRKEVNSMPFAKHPCGAPFGEGQTALTSTTTLWVRSSPPSPSYRSLTCTPGKTPGQLCTKRTKSLAQHPERSEWAKRSGVGVRCKCRSGTSSSPDHLDLFLELPHQFCGNFIWIFQLMFPHADYFPPCLSQFPRDIFITVLVLL